MWVEMAVCGSFDLGCCHGGAFFEIYVDVTFVLEYIFEEIVEVNDPLFDHRQYCVDDGLVIDDHVGEVERAIVQVNLDRLVSKVIIIEVGPERKIPYLKHTFSLHLKVICEVCVAVLQQVFS